MAEETASKSQLRRAMGFWDVLLFNIAAVLGPRWIASAAHNGTSSISLWVLAAVLFFLPTALIIIELSTRYPAEGGLYVWSKEAFGDFHGFVAGWAYWSYTVFYFPGLLTASVAMSVYIGGPKYWALAKDPQLSALVVYGASCRGSDFEHHRIEHRQMVAKRGGHFHLFAFAHVDWHWCVPGPAPGKRNTFFLPKHFPASESGYGQLNFWSRLRSRLPAWNLFVP